MSWVEVLAFLDPPNSFPEIEWVWSPYYAIGR